MDADKSEPNRNPTPLPEIDPSATNPCARINTEYEKLMNEL